MKLEKIKKTFCDYKLELSWGQVQAIAAALEQNHNDALADELYAEWQWYMDHVPGPGEDEEELEAQQKSAQNGGPEGEVEGEDLPIPMPPGQRAGTPPEGEGEDSAVPSEDEMSGAGESGIDEPGADVGLPEPEMGEGGGGGEGGEEEPEMALPEPPRE